MLLIKQGGGGINYPRLSHARRFRFEETLSLKYERIENVISKNNSSYKQKTK